MVRYVKRVVSCRGLEEPGEGRVEYRVEWDIALVVVVVVVVILVLLLRLHVPGPAVFHFSRLPVGDRSWRKVGSVGIGESGVRRHVGGVRSRRERSL